MLKNKMTNIKVFGQPIVGEWICLTPGCGFHIFPNPLRDQQEDFIWGVGATALKEGYVGPVCPKCGAPLEYDEAE